MGVHVRLWLLSAMTALAVVLISSGVSAAQAAETCRDDVVYLRGEFGSARFSVELATNGQERARGLMFRKQMPKSHGMLFVYGHPQRVSFWMKNTLIPLDMLFVDQHGIVQRVNRMAMPGDLKSFFGGNDILVVLEINGGLAKAMGIGPGTVMRHPAFGAQAAWACE
ncbi:DUF192 domain-containing protein [Aquicoccus sp. G2-2]|uniref:DUF192 domain-containing protein n=1 Tax=Aquicoccus sp. G2-2 TaxID=3092120 RepID=UPI002ADF1061|nr:DUF192 domain-containing protein [Aquicoccus sp. G2-2]MEA1113214.1 DUF192 domain-containing protein [Aquicoccus sp. G2-2]